MCNKSILGIAVAILTSAMMMAQDPAEVAEEKAISAARSWLDLIDQGRYAESWEKCATLARNAVSKDQWVQSMQSARKLFGKRLARTVKSSEYATTLPGAPDGHYVVIQYETSFERKDSAIETVTPMLDPDGQWRVSGYFIK